jgi:hypothetical protein
MNRRENEQATHACGLAGEIVRTFGEVRLRVFGTSMVPSVLPGDVISVRRTGISEISSGEIVLYSRDGRLFAHRVVACTETGVGHAASETERLLVTRGDRLGYDDPPVSTSELLGRANFIQRSGGECGDSRMRTAVSLGGWRRIVARLLRYSDRATYLYVRLIKLGLAVARFTVNIHREPHAVPPELGSGEFQRSARRAECRG